MELDPSVSEADPVLPSRLGPGFALLGVLAAGAALAASELVAGLFVSAPSLVRTIGQRVIDVTPVPIVDWAIRMFGTNDKLVLVIGIVLVSLGIGALLGLLARDRPVLASAGFVVFGAVGFVVGLTDPLAGVGLTLVAAVAAAGMGVGALLGLRSLLVRSAGPADSDVAGSRRAFVTAAGAAVVVAVVQVFLGRYLGSRAQSAAVGREQVTLPTAFPTAEPAATPSADGVSDTTVPEFEPIETAVPEFEPTEPEFLPTDTPEAAGTAPAGAETTEPAETASTTQPTPTETTQAPETTTTQAPQTTTTQAPETTTTAPTQTETTQPAESTTTQAPQTTTTQAPETTTTTQAPQTTTTQAPETTTTTQAPQTTTTQAPETTTTTQAPQTTTTQAPTTTTTQPTAAPRVSGVAAPTAAQIAPVEGVSELITPNEEFYVVDTAIGVPQVDHRTWTLSFTGRVDNPFTVTYDELLAMPLVERYITLCCVSNQVGGEPGGQRQMAGRPPPDPGREGRGPQERQPAGRPLGRPVHGRLSHGRGVRRARGPGGGGDERRAAPAPPRLPGPAGGLGPVRIRVRDQMADRGGVHGMERLRRLLGPEGMGQESTHQDPVADRHAPGGEHQGRDQRHRRGRLGPDPGHLESAGPGRRRRLDERAPSPGTVHRHLAAVVPGA